MQKKARRQESTDAQSRSQDSRKLLSLGVCQNHGEAWLGRGGCTREHAGTLVSHAPVTVTEALTVL